MTDELDIKSQRKAEINQQISNLQNEFNKLNAEKEQLIKQKDELALFSVSLDNEYTSYHSSIDSINTSISNIEYDQSSIDSCLSSLEDINLGIKSLTNTVLTDIDGKKTIIDKFVSQKQTEIKENISSKGKEINAIEVQINKLKMELSTLG